MTPSHELKYVIDELPTINEMRKVAKYMNDVMHLHSASGKLFAKATEIEKMWRHYYEAEEKSKS